MPSGRLDIVKFSSLTPLSWFLHVYPHTLIYRKILTPLINGNLWVPCLILLSNYQHQTLLDYHTQVILHPSCALFPVSEKTNVYTDSLQCLGSEQIRASS